VIFEINEIKQRQAVHLKISSKGKWRCQKLGA